MMQSLLCIIWSVMVVPSISDTVETTDNLGKLVDLHANTSTLVHVHAIWRHGLRTPVVLIPSDPLNGKSSWPQGLGELTVEGARQQYRLGEWLRQRYSGFLKPQVEPGEIYVRSSDYNRTLMSAQALLAGLYPANNDNSLSDRLKWWPLPVHTVRRATDEVLYDEIECPKADREFQRIMSTEPVLKVENENAALIKLIAEKSGYDDFHMRKIWWIYDPLMAQRYHNDTHPFPSWVNETVWDGIVQLYNKVMYFCYSSNLFVRLHGGMLRREIRNRLDRITQNVTNRSEKMYAYSAHDLTVAPFLASMGIRPQIFPLYSTVVLLELHSVNNEFILKLFFKNTTDSPLLYEFPIVDCGSPCKIEQFLPAIDKYIPKDPRAECKLVGLNSAHQWILIGVISLLSLITVIFGVITIKGVISDLCGFKRRYRGRSISDL
ncbi:hypothetical protein AB6A40_003806 [Gnathostoma spinigerum]|uniref:Acid phosphatase n=1 Tax=Gnathostoma spinigerum TaxID=75299 RepID=A0ABD6ECV0_9BILA